MRLLALLFCCVAAPLWASDITSARYISPTDVYGHGALPGGEYEALEVTLSDHSRLQLRYEGAVFEDTAPRLHDFDGDGRFEVVTVISDFKRGARVEIFGLRDGALTPIARTDPIGIRHRWLAISGIADFDGDGRDEIAFVDRPHLAREVNMLRVERVSAQEIRLERFTYVGPKLSNHRYGAAEIEGGIRACDGLELLLANGAWSEIVAVRFQDGVFSHQSLGPYEGPESFANHQSCE